MKKWMLLILAILLSVSAYGQAPDTSLNLQGKGIRGPYSLGFRNLISVSVSINGHALSPDSFTVQYEEGLLFFQAPLPINDSILVRFQYLPLNLKPKYFLYSLERTGSDSSSIQMQSPAASGDFGSDLKITGSKGFSIQTGDVSGGGLSQSLNLSIAGELFPGLRTSAHISDKSSGQSGVSRRLEELDKIYIVAESDNFKGVFGDFDLIGQPDPLLGFQRKLTGLNASYSKKGGKFETAAAFFPGVYASIIISGHDGRLGPYYLTDIGGRRGTQILPGSERLYLDGILQRRGSQNDYEIDYEAGAVQFAPSKIIRDETRITIDYEISREEYSRSFYSLSGNLAPSGGWRLFSTLIQEGDNKNFPKSFELTSEDRAILENAGPDRLSAYKSGAKYVGPLQGDYVFDTVAVAHYIYVGLNRGDYQVAFSFMGLNNGSYNSAGGGSFNYVGRGLGEYEPVILIPLPEIKRYGSVGTQWNSGDSAISIGGELAGSLYDRNTFSNKDDTSPGVSVIGQFSFRRIIFDPDGFFAANARARKIGRQSIFPGRIDDVERYRKYDLDTELSRAGEKIEEAGIAAGFDKRRSLALEFGYLTHPQIKSRVRQAGRLDWKLFGPLNISSAAERIYGTRTWLKRRAVLSADLKQARPSFQISFERRDGQSGFKFYEYAAEIPATYAADISGATAISFRDEKYYESNWRHKFLSGSLQQSLDFIFGQSGFSGELTGSYYKKHFQDFPGIDSEQKTGRARLSFSDPAGRGSFSVNERLGASSERLQVRNYIYVGGGKGEYRLEDGQYFRDPQGDYIAVIEELGDGARITEIATEIGGNISPLLILDASRKLEEIAGRLSFEANLAYKLRKSSDILAANDFVPWRIGSFTNIILQNGQLDIRAYYYLPHGDQRIKYSLSRTFEKGAPFANEANDNDSRSHELSWGFPAGKRIDISLSGLVSSEKHRINLAGYNIHHYAASMNTNYRFRKFWTLTNIISYDVARQSDTGLRANLPKTEIGLTRDFQKSGRISVKFGYTRMNVSPANAYVPFQVAQGKNNGDNLEGAIVARMSVGKNGRLDMSYRYENFARRSTKNNFRLEFTLLFL